LKALLRYCGRGLTWVGPVLVLLAVVSGGFLYWTLTTEAGTRWLLVTAARQFGAQVQQVRGALWEGVSVGRLDWSQPAWALQARDLTFQADWQALRQGRLHVQTLSAQSLILRHQTPAKSAASAPLAGLPELPLMLIIDKLAIAQLQWQINGAVSPARISALDAAVVAGEHVQVVLRHMTLTHAQGEMTLQGDATLAALQAPWPVQVALSAQAHTNRRDSPLCISAFVPAPASVPGAVCAFQLQWQAQGTVEVMETTLQGRGQGLELDAYAKLQPSAAWPVQQARANLALGDGATLSAQLDWQIKTPAQQQVHGQLRTRGLDVARLSGVPGIPLTTLGLDSRFDLRLRDNAVTALELDVRILGDTRWQQQPLYGTVQVQTQFVTPVSLQRLVWIPDTWRIPKLALNLTLGQNRVVLDGALGEAKDRLRITADVPALAEVHPSLSGGAQLDGQVRGNMAQHDADLKATFTPAHSQPQQWGAAPLHTRFALNGRWYPDTRQWRAQMTSLQLQHAQWQADFLVPLPLAWEATDAWTFGTSRVRVSLEESALFVLEHQGSRIDPTQWETRGAIPRLYLSDTRVRQVRQYLQRQGLAANMGQLPVTLTAADTNRKVNDLTLTLDWQLRLHDAVEGTFNLRRHAGDLVIPWDTPVAMALQELRLSAQAVRRAAGRSQVQAQAVIRTAQMGALTLELDSSVHATRQGGLWLEPQDTAMVSAQADMADLAWINLFSQLPVELGGAVSARLQAHMQPGGHWTATGNLTGKGIRLIYLDEGIRLLDGSLTARFDDQRFVLERLHFPARLRVVPREERTRAWVRQDQAQNGGLTVSGGWDMARATGVATVQLQQYPLLQRADRYAMLSGNVRIDARLPTLAVTGALHADAGWVDLDIVSGVPAVDSDVRVVRAGQPTTVERLPATGTQATLDMTLDLGERFYLTGYGVDSALAGNLRLVTQAGRLHAEGALDTHDGTVTAYGQRLQLQRGTLTFQGDISSPVLNIVAVRSGDLAVQAGVRVAGTARRPRIDLISSPEVNEVEKLSWLLFGRGPDESGGDVALLLSVGTAFFTAGEPFYRQLGLDELQMRSGTLGATGSLLPVESVVRSLDSAASEIERQFVVASKNIGQDFTFSIEQALSDTGTVGRISYRLARGLTAQLSAGTVNGLALVYRWFSRENRE